MISIIITTFNEVKTIKSLLNSVLGLRGKPEEVVIVDGGSTDKTVQIIEEYKNKFKKRGIDLRVYIKKGNRSVGRNEAIRLAKGEIIAITDAGCELDKDWLKNITQPFKDKTVNVVSGYYSAKTETIFEKCVVPYVLVMPDKIKTSEFLPATRSMAIRKKTWKDVGGFPEEYSDNEDYVFANLLKKRGEKIIFAQNAIVYWYPRKNLKDFYKMIFRFARGDAKSGLRKIKYMSYFIRYFIFIILGILGGLGPLRPRPASPRQGGSEASIWVGLGIFIFYLFWAIVKNYKYVNNWQAIVYLPVLQIVSDIAIMAGIISGMRVTLKR